MEEVQFTDLLDTVCAQLTEEAQKKKFLNSKSFEDRVRHVVNDYLRANIDTSTNEAPIQIDFNSAAQGFPDIPVGKFGIEVKHEGVVLIR